MGTELQFGDVEISGEGWLGWLHNRTNTPDATELCAIISPLYHF